MNLYTVFCKPQAAPKSKYVMHSCHLLCSYVYNLFEFEWFSYLLSSLDIYEGDANDEAKQSPSVILPSCLMVDICYKSVKLNGNRTSWNCIYFLVNKKPNKLVSHSGAIVAPMGVLAHGSAHAWPSAGPPIDTCRLFPTLVSEGGRVSECNLVKFIQL